MVETVKARVAAFEPPLPELAPRKIVPIKWWAAVGAAFALLQLYVYGAWIVTGKATATPHGPDPIPSWMQFAMRTAEVTMTLSAIFMIYWFLVRPWRRERTITFDGMMLIGFVSIYWMDPLANWFAPWTAVNSGFYNLGSWAANVPGFRSPNGNLFAEPLLMVLPLYVAWMVPGVLLGCAVMRRAKRRWPELGKFGQVAACYAVIVFFDVLCETIFVRLGFYTYPGSIRWMALFPGKYYQMPLFEYLVWPMAWTSFTCLRYFRNDKGESFAERGLERVRISRRNSRSLRTLSIIGIMHVACIVFYQIPAAVYGLYSDPWPADHLNRSYLTDGLCGPRTGYACPGPAIPVPRPDSAHISPSGELIVPPGTQLPR